MGTRDLTILSGVSADKAARYERWGEQHDVVGNTFADRMAKVLEQLIASGTTITVEPAKHGERVIDVEAAEAPDS